METIDEGVECEDVDSQHVAEQESEDGDEVLCFEYIVELEYAGKEVEAYEDASDKETGKEWHSKHGWAQTCALEGCAGSDAGHDKCPEEVYPPTIELEEVLQVESDEVELHYHANKSLQGGMHQGNPQAGKYQQRNQHQQESECKAKKRNFSHFL